MDKKGFPENFIWGAASASAQIEGGFDEDGRTLSIWDIAPKKKIKNGEDCHVSCDHYHRMKEDVALMKKLGLKAYRFSISWSRVIPEEGVVNQKGLQFYSDLVDELLAAGIEPFVTIYHWDMPVWVYKKGGWLSEKIITLFTSYTETVVNALSDRVTKWFTINEPGCFLMNGYMQGTHAPFKRDYLSLNRLLENCMRSHWEAVRTIRKKAILAPMIGIAFSSGAFVPGDESDKEIENARRLSMEEGPGLMSNRLFMDPLLGKKSVKAYGIYHVKQKMIDAYYEPVDFIGLNIYTSLNYNTWDKSGQKPDPGIPRNSLGWVIDERVMYWNVKFVYEKYRMPIMITENGLAENDIVSLDGRVHDPQRTDFIFRYLTSLLRAINEDIPVLGYLHWSIMDNFEWAEGYEPRFGLIYVDFNTQKRIVKDSGWEFKRIIDCNGKSLLE